MYFRDAGFESTLPISAGVPDTPRSPSLNPRKKIHMQGVPMGLSELMREMRSRKSA